VWSHSKRSIVPSPQPGDGDGILETSAQSIDTPGLQAVKLTQD